MKIAVITGASSGLGREFFDIVATERKDLDEIWIIARRADKLNECVSMFPDVKVVPLTMDLSRPESIDEFSGELSKRNATVSLIINNAGFGIIGELAEADPKKQGAMVDLNCRALTEMTTVALRHMDRGGVIINTCSIASFAPNPRMTVYCSTKAYVMSFSRSLRFELKKRGINVLAVCPGPMSTEFLPVAGIAAGTSHAFDTLPRCDVRKTAKGALNAASKGRAVYTPLFFYKFYRVVAKILPHSLVMHFTKT